MSGIRRYLFLQGVCSPFFARLADALRQEGHKVRKVNFTVGDRVYWRQGEAVAFHGCMDGLPDFYVRQYRDYGITDIVLFGDCRPVHRPAIELAPRHGVRTHVFEEGYFRPYWITLERDGVNGHSRLPKHPKWYRSEAKRLSHFNNGTPFHSPFWKRAAYDLGYNFWAGLNPVLHTGVRSHVPYSPLREYLSYVRRGVQIKFYEAQSRAIEEKLILEAKEQPFYLMPLQLAHDAQIVHHSPFKDMAEALRKALVSFAQFSVPTARFAAKVHPLDPGLVNYRKLLEKWSRELCIEGRTFYLESGNLPALLSHSAGIVTVNSTVGGSALTHGRPTIALGRALYDLPGLTFQGDIDDFWANGQRPSRRLFMDFRDVVIHKTQINGGFYSSAGIDLAIRNCIDRLTTKD